jgi:methionine-rich copper-binding protein CopC
MKKSPLALAVVASIFPSAAFAHAHLLSQSPLANESVATPSQLALSFSEGLEAELSGVVVKTSRGAPVGTGIASLDPKTDKTLIVPLAGKLSPGEYAVEWHVLSKDGHVTKGTYHFRVLP